MEKNGYPPYIYDFFRVIPLFKSSNGSADGALHRTYNAIVEGLNEYIRLPRYVFIILDCDIIVHTNFFAFGVRTILEKEVTWLMKQMEHAFLSRRDALKAKSLGAAGKYPKIIWIKMLPRPYVKSHPIKFFNNTISLRQKYNEIIETTALSMQQVFIMEIEKKFTEQTNNFDQLARLTFQGKKAFWQNFDYQFKRFDRGEIQLPPAQDRRSRSTSKLDVKK